MSPDDANEVLWTRHAAEWRDPAQIASQWEDAGEVEPELLESRVTGDWWGLLEELGITLFVTREYEHLVLALSARGGRPSTTFFRLPHPSGLVADREGNRLYIASTRNPNQVFILMPAPGLLNRKDTKVLVTASSPLVPVSSDFYPGSMYIHDLALIGGELYANAVGHNSIVKLERYGGFRRVWWPNCVVREGRPSFEQNYIQLNSIAAGKTLQASYYSASSSQIGRLRPGHLGYKVDKQGVIFSGRTREPYCSGLTRPHSARMWQGDVWVANSGYGEVGYADKGRLEVVCKLPGWTRGLCMSKGVAFAGTSRVIPKYSRYAPGLKSDQSRCGVHAVCTKTARVLGSIEWPTANQIFAIDWIGDNISPGFVFEPKRLKTKQELAFFYRYLLESNLKENRLGAQ